MDEALTKEYLAALETELQQTVELSGGAGLGELRGMLAYHMGWEGEGAGPQATGKRIRPLLVLLCTAAAGGEWRKALPAATAVELIHNFSLIHDDIEDNSPLRRGRLTVWKRWGIPQALNAGDAMFSLAHLALLGLAETASADIAVQAARLLQQTCLTLTQGQFLDLSYEDRLDLTQEDYWPMVGGKTAALLAACTELGPLVAGRQPSICQAYGEFGRLLGLAFQAQDDLLGIWGDAALTGKSAESDLVSGKKSLPTLYGLSLGGPFARRWQRGPVGPEEVTALAKQLAVEGARDFTQEAANRLTAQALQALDVTDPQGEAGVALRELAEKLLARRR